MALLAALVCCSMARADDKNARREYFRGLRAEKARHYAEAIREYRAALEEEPTWDDLDRRIGNCFYYLGEKAEAVQYYDRYLEEHPEDAKVRNFSDSLRGGPFSGDSSYSSYKGAITVNPITLIIGEADLQYEARLHPDSSMAYRLLLWDLSVGDTSFNAFGLGAAYRMYPGGAALHRFYWGPGASIESVSVKLTDPYAGVTATGTGVVFGPSIEMGWQWVPFDAWAIDLGVSGSYYLGSVSASADGYKSSAALSGFSPGIRFGMGYAWH